MTNTTTLMNRNLQFAAEFNAADLPIIPKLRSVIICCVDARVDPAHILGLELGESVVIRNNGGRVNQSVINELATLAFMVAKMDGEKPGPFEVMIIQHTQCGAERFADPAFQKVLKEHIGVDVSKSAIKDHKTSLLNDVEFMRQAPELPAYITVSGYLYDVQDGQVNEVIAPNQLKAQRRTNDDC